MRFVFDRRSGEDRRKAHDMDYFLEDGAERRDLSERRSRPERRSGWVRAGEWYSICLRFIKGSKIFRGK